jgi:carbonic anhydrase
MEKLLAGIREFRRNQRPAYVRRFAHLALGQSPDCLFFACSDSRVVPNLFASTDPGDLFVVRNPGNAVPACAEGYSVADLGEGAAIEFALDLLKVPDIVVCGHSSCGAMRALEERPPHLPPHLAAWLDLSRDSIDTLAAKPDLAPGLPSTDRLSQAHVLRQLENLRSYPSARIRLEAGSLRLHAWWFDLSHAEVHAWSEGERQFIPLVDL